MGKENRKKPSQDRRPLEIPTWYFGLVFFLAFLSLVTLSQNAIGEWQVALGIHQATPLLIVLAILPPILKFFVRETKKGSAGIPGLFSLTWDNVSEIDEELAENKTKFERAGEAAKIKDTNQDDIQELQKEADLDLEERVALQDLPFVQQIYLQKLNELVKEFNRNRHWRKSGKSTVAEADEIAYKMRSMAPLLFGQLDLPHWLDSPNLGKRLAAIKYLDWAQDIEFAEDLASRLQELENDGDTFQTFHILLALMSMADQMAFDYKDKVAAILAQYTPKDTPSSRTVVRDRILEILS